MLGVNTRVELAQAEAVIQDAAAPAAMLAGATLTAPATVCFCAPTRGSGATSSSSRTSCSARRDRGGRRRDPRVLAHRGRRDRGGRASSGRSRGCGPARRSARRAYRQLRRGQGGQARRPAPRPTTCPISATAIGAGTNIGAGTITCNYDGFNKCAHRRSAKARLSARTRRWWRRLRSVTAPMSRPAAWSRRTCRPDALAIARARQVDKPGGAPRVPRGEGGGEGARARRKSMCGIIGIIGKRAVAADADRGAAASRIPRLRFGRASRRWSTAASSAAAPRASSAISRRCCEREPLHGTIGIGHTRWATHGAADRGQRASDRDRPGRRRP